MLFIINTLIFYAALTLNPHFNDPALYLPYFTDVGQYVGSYLTPSFSSAFLLTCSATLAVVMMSGWITRALLCGGSIVVLTVLSTNPGVGLSSILRYDLGSSFAVIVSAVAFATFASTVLSVLFYRSRKSAPQSQPQPQRQEPQLRSAPQSQRDGLVRPGEVCVFKTGTRDIEMTVLQVFDDTLPPDMPLGQRWKAARVGFNKGDGDYVTKLVPWRMLVAGHKEDEEEEAYLDVGDDALLPDGTKVKIVATWKDTDEVPSDFDGDTVTDDYGDDVMPWVPARVTWYEAHRGSFTTKIVPFHVLQQVAESKPATPPMMAAAEQRFYEAAHEAISMANSTPSATNAPPSFVTANVPGPLRDGHGFVSANTATVVSRTVGEHRDDSLTRTER